MLYRIGDASDVALPEGSPQDMLLQDRSLLDIVVDDSNIKAFDAMLAKVADPVEREKRAKHRPAEPKIRPSGRPGRPSFAQIYTLTLEDLKRIFIGRSTAFDYAFNHITREHIPFNIVTHPEITFTCGDKADMYNRYNCSRTELVVKENLTTSEKWDAERDTIKAVYFIDALSNRYHIVVASGEAATRRIDVKETMSVVLESRGISHRRIRLFPADVRLPFDVMQEGCMSGIIPVYAQHMTEAVYFDYGFLTRYEPGGDKSGCLDDLSLAMQHIILQGGGINQLIKKEAVAGLKEAHFASQDELQIPKSGYKEKAGDDRRDHREQKAQVLPIEVHRPLLGECRHAMLTPCEGDGSCILRYRYVPNTMLSALIGYDRLNAILVKQFGRFKDGGLVANVDIAYE